ncbi:MAG: formate dehydrogenase [Methyloligellaceae bacterium]
MKRSQDKTVADRRSFLRLAGLGTVAGGAALVAGGGAAEADTAADDKDRLYSETDHVKTYYQLARF